MLILRRLAFLNKTNQTIVTVIFKICYFPQYEIHNFNYLIKSVNKKIIFCHRDDSCSGITTMYYIGNSMCYIE